MTQRCMRFGRKSRFYVVRRCVRLEKSGASPSACHTVFFDVGTLIFLDGVPWIWYSTGAGQTRSLPKEVYDMEMVFYRCEHCGQIVAIVKKTGVPIMCCGQPMKEIVPGTTDASVEKHVPVYTTADGIVTVTVGSVTHPMLPEHYIEWIALKTKFGNQRKVLKPGDEPKACFAICEGDEVEAVYAYCNLHSLWKA